MENQEFRGLRIASGILFRVFIIGYLFLIVAWGLYMLLYPHWSSLFVNQWHVPSMDTLNLVTLGYFALAKFVLFFYALVPAIAIRLTIRQWTKKPR